MAYAKLVFPAGTYALKKLKEIVRFATGNITSLSDLQFADQSLSEFVIMDQPGWSLSGGQTFEAGTTATIAEYRLQSSCINPSKVKYITLGAWVYRTINHYIPTTGAWLLTNNSYVGSTSTSGVLYCQMGTSFTGSTLDNSTWRLNSFYTKKLSGGGSVNVNYEVPATNLSESIFYVFCSNRKILILAPEASGRCDLAGVLEFPETIFSSKVNNLPALAIMARYISNATPYGPVYNYAEDIPGGTQYRYVYNSFQLSNWYSPTLGSANRNLYDYGTNNAIIQITPSLNITASGQTAYPLIPMTDIRVVYGEGIHNYSILTDVYMTYRPTLYLGQGDTLNVSGIPYVVLQVGDNTGNYRALAIKKG